MHATSPTLWRLAAAVVLGGWMVACAEPLPQAPERMEGPRAGRMAAPLSDGGSRGVHGEHLEAGEAPPVLAQAGRPHLAPAQTTLPWSAASERRPAAETWRAEPRAEGSSKGIWVSYPPVEMAIDLLGPDAVQRCVDALTHPVAAEQVACTVEIAPCQRLVLPISGQMRMEVDAACYRGQVPAPLWQLQRELPAAPRVGRVPGT